MSRFLFFLLIAAGLTEAAPVPVRLKADSAYETLKPAAASGLTVRDVDGRGWSLLAPPSGQIDLLFFIATDCPISNRYVPEIVRLCGDYQARGVRCFTIYPETADTAAVKRHRQDFGIDAAVPAILDPAHRLVAAVGPRVTPEAAIYSPDGRRYRGRIDNLYVDVGRARREATQHDLRLALDASLAGRPVAHADTDAIGCVIPK